MFLGLNVNVLKKMSTFTIKYNLLYMDDNNDLNCLKLVLVKKKKTGVWLAEKLGVTPVTVSKWCSNITQPSLQTLGRIATLLEVDPRELLKGKE